MSRIMSAVLPAILLLLLGLIWDAWVYFLDVPAYILPSPRAVLQTVILKRNLLLDHTLITLAEIGLGFAIALIVGAVLAVLIHSSKIVARAVLPLVIASQTIPVFAIAPLLIIWFGYGLGSKVVMTAIIVFFPMVINMARGLDAADPDTIALLTILEATPTQIFFKVRLPQSLPFVFSGLKIGVAVSAIGAVIGEWVGAQKGLGYLMMHANAQLRVDLVFAAIFCLSVMSIVLYLLVGLAEKLIVPKGLGGE